MHQNFISSRHQVTAISSTCCYRRNRCASNCGVRIEENGKTTVSPAADTDTLVASANAYINALNKMIIKRDKTAPDNIQVTAEYDNKVRGI